jgi:hypothetical protein
VEVPGYETVSAETSIPLFTPVFNTTELSEQQPAQEEFGYLYRYDIKWQDEAETRNYYRVCVINSNFPGGTIANNYFTDEEDNGALISDKIEVSGFNETGEGVFRFYLMNVSEEYYLYMRSLENITYGDPFSEPSLVYSNITNGLGCFAGFNGSVVEVEIPG